ncbi:MAG: SagB/ThcOx family dehydrogenase, partial [Candidatus Cloacimonadaceae bacterium]|nr:SagB/ThcOx family dehydrogenase [Candidatus Cloacimonadaceae bacterium]
MDIRTFGYLFYKIRGYDKEEIIKQAEITPEDYDFYEDNLGLFLAEIEQERPRAEGIGADFVHLTRYIYDRSSDQEQKLPRPDATKVRSGEIIPIPAVGTLNMPTISLQKSIEQRRSLRKYANKELTPEELSFLLWTCSWARDFISNEKIEITLRNVPSAGARHPLETYLLINSVRGIKPGLYYYHPVKHCLILVNEDEDIAVRVYDG